MPATKKRSSTKVRGSAKLSGRKISEGDLARIVRATKARGVKVVDWTILGQPAPDSVVGTVHVPIGRAPRLIAELLRLGRLRPNLDVFPIGIPNPRTVGVKFKY